MNKFFIIATLLLGICITASAQKYKISKIGHERLTVDATYERPNTKADAFVKPFKEQIDAEMSPMVGHCARNMDVNRPESEMSNLLSDILIWIAKKDFNEEPVMSVYNMGGIRAVFSKGVVAIGDVIDVAPFENKICFVTLKGTQLMELFTQIARRGGEGVSKGVELIISNKGELKSARLHGKEIVADADYRIATIDYLLEGNDGMPAMRQGTNIVAPKDKKNDTRFLIMDYFRAMEAQGITVDAQIEGRIRVEK